MDNYVSCLSCFLACSLQPCGHLLAKGWPLDSLVCDFLLCFVTFPCGVLGQVWCVIVQHDLFQNKLISTEESIKLQTKLKREAGNVLFCLYIIN